MKLSGQVVALLLWVVAVSYVTAGVLQFDDEKDLDNEYAREVAAWVIQALHREPSATFYAHKRNSEIINSLLGLPKVMKDAGRRK